MREPGEEYELKIQGASYEEIARKGGGILNSVKKLRAATDEALKRRAIEALEEFALTERQRWKRRADTGWMWRAS